MQSYAIGPEILHLYYPVYAFVGRKTGPDIR